MKTNKLIIAAAGSGKTTFLVNEALKIKGEKVLITTYTLANEEEIRKKIIKINKCIPENIIIQTWFSLLLQHGVRPYQDCLCEKKINGMILVNSQSGVKYYIKGKIPVCFKEDTEIEKHYFNDTFKIYSDKISKFVYKCNQMSEGAVISRLSRIFQHIFIDEIQDLAGYDLELLKLLFKSHSNILLVGDPRQVTYLTHNEKKYDKYRNGLIKEFVLNECSSNSCEIDEEILNSSFRCNKQICSYAAKLYPNFKACSSCQNETKGHEGIFLVSEKDVDKYLEEYNPVQLRDKVNVSVNKKYKVFNFGESKGLTFDRVLVYPTKPFINWMINNSSDLPPTSRCKFYVALTRAKYSVGIVYNHNDETKIDGVEIYNK
jgi:DNA helicase-2/ATP-dependent DNA helicase PcrA